MTPYSKFIVRRVSDLAICRRLKKRSLLEVNEHFSGKRSAEDNPLFQIYCQKGVRFGDLSQAEKAEFT